MDITSIEKQGNVTESYLKIIGTNGNFVVLNTIRRLLHEYIPIYSFSNIKFINNTSVYNNDQLRLRIESMPIINFPNSEDTIDRLMKIIFESNSELEQTDNEQLYMNCDVFNNNDTILNVTTDMCKYYHGGQQINNIYPMNILICQLKKGQHLKFSCNSKLYIALNSDLWTPICKCYYNINDDKSFMFYCESRGQIDEINLIIRACKLMIMIIKHIATIIETHVFESNEDTIFFQGCGHTICNFLNDAIQDHPNVKQAGYKQEHQLIRNTYINIVTDGTVTINKIISDIITDRTALLNSIITKLRELS